MKKSIVKGALLLFLATSLSGCYPDGPDFVDEFDVVYTNYDENFSFAGKNTYAIPDSVVKITAAATNGDPIEFVKPPYNKIILDRIRANMTSNGYQEVNDPAVADFVLFPSALEVTNIVYYYDYWGYYYGWYYPPGYGGWYYPYPVTSTYTTGSLIMSLAENGTPSPTGKNKVVWLGVINGVLEGGSSDFTSRINKTIDQAFTQSPYLHP